MIRENGSVNWITWFPLMIFFPPTLHNKSTGTLLAVCSYWLVCYFSQNRKKHSSYLCLFTAYGSAVRLHVIHISSSFSGWLKCTGIDHRFQSIAWLSSSMKSFSVTLPLSHFPLVWYIQSLPVRRLTSYGHSTAPDYVFLWSFSVSQ